MPTCILAIGDVKSSPFRLSPPLSAPPVPRDIPGFIALDLESKLNLRRAESASLRESATREIEGCAFLGAGGVGGASAPERPYGILEGGVVDIERNITCTVEGSDGKGI